MCTSRLQIQVRINVLSLKSTEKARTVRILCFSLETKFLLELLSPPGFYYKQEGESSQPFKYFP